MKILITGANGHIGSNVVRAAIDAGHEPIGLVRKGSDLRGLEGLDVPLRVGDVLDGASIERAVEGCDAVIHTAANFSIWGARDDIVAPSVKGTQNVFAAAAKHGVRRIVATSSCVAAGLSHSPERIRDESDWRDETHLAYYRAKLDGERVAFAEGERHAIETITVLPTLVLGRHDYRITPSMKPILDMANGASPTIDGGANIVDVRDVASVHVRALERGRPNERYLAGGDNVTMRELGNLLTSHTGKKLKHLSLPPWAFMTIATMMELGAKVSGKPPAMTRDAVRDVLGRYAWFDCSKMRRELGVEPRGKDEVVRETLGWLLERELLVDEVARSVRESLQGRPRAA